MFRIPINDWNGQAQGQTLKCLQDCVAISGHAVPYSVAHHPRYFLCISSQRRFRKEKKNHVNLSNRSARVKNVIAMHGIDLFPLFLNFYSRFLDELANPTEL